jgi:hypothetical protein
MRLTDENPKILNETLVSLWHSWWRYDWRALCVTNEAMHLTYLGSPNPLLVFLGPIGAIIMQVQARYRYRDAVIVPVDRRIQLYPKNITINKGDIRHIEGASRKVSITTNNGKIYKIVRMGDGNLMTMTSKLTSD